MCLKIYPSTQGIQQKIKHIFHYKYRRYYCHPHYHNEQLFQVLERVTSSPPKAIMQYTFALIHVHVFEQYRTRHFSFAIKCLLILVLTTNQSLIKYRYFASNNSRHGMHVPAKGSQPGESDHFRVPVVEGGMKSL